MPFFSEHRLVIVENSGWFKNKAEKLPDHLENFPDTTVLLFLEEETDKRNRLYKAVQKRGYLCELTHPERRELSVWAARYLAAAGKKLTFLICTDGRFGTENTPGTAPEDLIRLALRAMAGM